VRRILAIALLAIFSFSLIAPGVYASDAGSKLPACCRRDGNHHCALAESQTGSSSGPALQASKCPMFPGCLAVPVQAAVGLANCSRFIFAAVISHPASHPQIEALYRMSFSRAGQKRGPPRLLFS